MEDTVLVRISLSDRDRIKQECRQIYLKHHPEMINLHLSMRFMISKIVDWYIKSPGGL
jgi:hypothetical protein